MFYSREGASVGKGGFRKMSSRAFLRRISVGVHILLAVEQSSLESQSRGCAKTPTLTTSLALQSHQIVTSLLYIILATSLEELHCCTVTKCFQDWSPSTLGKEDSEIVQMASYSWRCMESWPYSEHLCFWGGQRSWS